MRHTLKTIGIEEERFMWRCRASFKQGGRFVGWRQAGQSYDHPFDFSSGFKPLDLIGAAVPEDERIERLASSQPSIIDRQLSPKRSTDGPYEGTLNYGYHFDSAALIDLLKEHATTTLNVKLLKEHIEGAETDERGYLTSLRAQSGRAIEGQLFVDCSGSRGLLIQRQYKAEWRSLKHLLFNNAALATHSPYLSLIHI